MRSELVCLIELFDVIVSYFFFFKQKTAYEMRISDWSSDVCSSDLLFIVGLELSPSRLWRMRRDIFGLGTLQVVLCGLALTGVVFFFTGFSLAASIALGLPLALSSTAQVLPMLQSAGRLRTPFRSEEHTSELQSLMRTSYAVFC